MNPLNLPVLKKQIADMIHQHLKFLMQLSFQGLLQFTLGLLLVSENILNSALVCLAEVCEHLAILNFKKHYLLILRLILQKFWEKKTSECCKILLFFYLTLQHFFPVKLKFDEAFWQSQTLL